MRGVASMSRLLPLRPKDLPRIASDSSITIATVGLYLYGQTVPLPYRRKHVRDGTKPSEERRKQLSCHSLCEGNIPLHTRVCEGG